MRTNAVVYALFLETLGGALSACGSSPPSPSTSASKAAVVGITVRTSTVEPITTPGTGWLYRVLYEVRETGGKTGATLTLAHWALSNGFSTNDNFSGAGVIQVPHVAAGGSITVESHLSVLTTAVPASHVDFTITYMGDDGQTGSVSTSADVSLVPPQ
jgi:uncharacterized protein affecting Mg2+/Co2+ transport